MRVEALEAIKSGGWVLSEGDSVQVPDELGARWCALGWARDASGATPTGERQVINARLAVTSARSGQRAKRA